MSYTHALTVDPGLRGTGLARWKSGDWFKLCGPVSVKNLYPKCKTDWLSRAKSLQEQFSAELDGVGIVYIEFPKFFEDSVKGQTAARRGDLLKLTFMVGLFVAEANRRGIRVVLVGVNEWKGQLPKEIVKTRILKKLPSLTRLRILSHSWDAIGIGLFKKGYLK